MDVHPRRVSGPPHLFLGLLIVTLGVIFFLDQQGIFPARESFHFFWTAVIVFWGIQIVAHARSGSGQLWGAFLILLGALFLVNELGFLHIRIGSLWPVALIAFGVWMLLGATGRLPHRTSQDWLDWGARVRARVQPPGNPSGSDTATPPPGSEDAEFIQSVIFSGFKRRITSQHFKYAKIATVFGGFNVDLTRADMDGNQAIIQVESVFGGGEIRIPDTWTVRIEGGALAGAIVDETYPRPSDAPAATKQLIVRGSVVFGGVVIKN